VSAPENIRLARRGSRWRSTRAEIFASLADTIEQLGVEAVDDPKVLTDLRNLGRIMMEVRGEAAAGSPAVRERKRRGQIVALEQQIADLKRGTT
jgi:hypothetical protein